METSVELVVQKVARDHARFWRDKPDEVWMLELQEEIHELRGALRRECDDTYMGDTPEWELVQIASICTNWLEKRFREGHELPIPIEMAKRHGIIP